MCCEPHASRPRRVSSHARPTGGGGEEQAGADLLSMKSKPKSSGRSATTILASVCTARGRQLAVHSL
jgi:hypothetical protein